MKNIFRFTRIASALFLIACLGVLMLPTSASAQQYSPTAVTATNWVAAASTNTAVNADITVTKYDAVALQVVFALQGAGTTACTFAVHESIDGTTYDDTAVQTLSVTPAGTDTVCGVLPISPGAVGYLRLKTIGNPNANAITNLVIKRVFKPRSNG